MTPQERLDWLLETVEKPNTQTVIVATVLEALGLDNARIALGSLQQVGQVDPIVGAAYQALATVGITLHQPDRQAMVAAIGQAAQWPSELTTAVQALGKTTGPRWQVDNLYEVEPTLEQVEAEMHAEVVAEQARQRQLAIQLRRRQWDEIATSIRAAIEIETISTLEQIIDAVEQGWSE